MSMGVLLADAVHLHLFLESIWQISSRARTNNTGINNQATSRPIVKAHCYNRQHSWISSSQQKKCIITSYIITVIDANYIHGAALHYQQFTSCGILHACAPAQKANWRYMWLRCHYQLIFEVSCSGSINIFNAKLYHE